MTKKLFIFVSILMVLSLILTGCATPTPETVIETVVVTEVVEVEGEVQVTEVVKEVEVEKEVVITATPEPMAQQLEVFHWWTGPGEREAADAMFAALADKYPEVISYALEYLKRERITSRHVTIPPV